MVPTAGNNHLSLKPDGLSSHISPSEEWTEREIFHLLQGTPSQTGLPLHFE